MRRICKDSHAVKSYQINWGAVLATGDTLVASTWTPESGINVDSQSFNDDTATVVVSGGTPDGEFSITNHITAASGREEDETLVFLISEE